MDHGGRMTGGSMSHLTNVKETPATEPHAKAIYDPFRTTSALVSYQQKIRDCALLYLMVSQVTNSKRI